MSLKCSENKRGLSAIALPKSLHAHNDVSNLLKNKCIYIWEIEKEKIKGDWKSGRESTRPIAMSYERLANSNRRTDGPTDGPTKRLIESRARD